MRRLLLLLVVVCVGLSANCQNVELSGQVLDDEEQALAFSSVLILKDTALVKGVITDEDGSFRTEVKPGTYLLKITYVGLKEYVDSLDINESLDLRTIVLKKEDLDLGEVLVTDFRNEVSAGIDKKVIRISEALRSSTTSLSEIMEMIPIVFMDMDGNPQIPGKQDVVVLVDGREPTIRANDLATMLRLIPSNQIVKIEIMTNPPSKYSKTNAAVINVVTNKAPQEGTILNAWLSTDALSAHGAGGNFTIKKGKFSLSSWGGKWAWKNRHEMKSTRINTEVKEIHRIEEEENSDYNGFGHYLGISPEFQINDKNIISAYVGGYVWNNENDSELNFNIYDDAGGKVNDYRREDFNVFNGKGFYSGIEYFKYFDEKEKELNFDIGFDIYTNESQRDGALLQDEPYSQRFSTFSESPTFEFAVEFFDPLDSTSSMNYAFELNKSFPYQSRQDFFAGSDFENLSRDDEFSYLNDLEEWNQELNITYSKKISKTTVSLDLGQVYYKINYQYDRIASVNRDFFFIIPKITINQKIGESNEIGLSYKYSSDAPDNYYLNPNIRFSSDGLWRSSGNPDLDAERSHELESNYGFYLGKFNIGTTAFWRYSKNAIQSYSTVDENGVRNNTFENNGEYTRTGVQLSLSGSVKKKLSINVSGSLYDSRIIQDDLENLQTLGYDVNASLRYFLPLDFTLGMSWRYLGPELSIQGEREGYYSLSSSLRKSFWKNKVNVSLVFNDLARSMSYVTETKDESFNFNSTVQRLPAFWRIRVNFKFGELKERPKSSKVGGQGG